MIPENTIASPPHVSGFSYPVKQPGDLLVDWELAGVALNDPSQGLAVKLWTLEALYNETTGLQDVTVSAPGVVPTVLFSGAGITEVALAFDQNMNPFVAYMQSGAPKIYWYDPIIPGMTTTALAAGCYDLRACLDEKRAFNVAESDIVLSYIRAGNLCVRYQRDRYGVEYVLHTDIEPGFRLNSVAMNNGFRLQFSLAKFVNPLVANPDESSVGQGETVKIPVLNNDTYYSQPVRLSQLSDIPKITRQPIIGFVSVNPDGTVNFVAPRGFLGQITFEYEIQTPPENE